jgi:hypothetical protein
LILQIETTIIDALGLLISDDSELGDEQDVSGVDNNEGDNDEEGNDDDEDNSEDDDSDIESSGNNHYSKASFQYDTTLSQDNAMIQT